MIFLPDTNAFSAFLSGRSAELTERMRAEFAAGTLRLSGMVLAELEFGTDFPRSNARIRTLFELGGHTIGDRDTLIAAQALALGATLVTRDHRKFSRVPGLLVENWEAV